MNEQKRFKILVGLGIVWLVIFIAMLLGLKINPRVELLVTAICLSWFAYWTVSMLWNKKPKVEQPEQPVEQKQTNVGKPKKTPKA
jgi:hypothetical protein